MPDTQKRKRPPVSGAGAGQSNGSRNDIDRHYKRKPGWHDVPEDKKGLLNFTIDLKTRDRYRSVDDAALAIETYADGNDLDHATVYGEVDMLWDMVTDDHRLKTILSGYETDPTPEVGRAALRKGSRWCAFLKIIARLQTAAGDDPFFLSANKLGELIDLDPRHARRFFNYAEKDGVLVKVADEVAHKRSREWVMPYSQDRNHAEVRSDADTTQGAEARRHPQDRNDTEGLRDTSVSRDALDATDATDTGDVNRCGAIGGHLPKQCPRCDGEGCRHCNHSRKHLSIEAQAKHAADNVPELPF